MNENVPRPENDIAEITKWMMGLAEPGSKTALRATSVRFAESQKLEGVRICYDPYAAHFISRAVLENPENMKAIKEIVERLLPGFSNSTIARVRYFDDFVKKSMDEGLEQLVILGAGYDTRAYRIEGLKKIRTFEVDHPATQIRKMEKIKKIFGSFPDQVTYIPVDLAMDNFGQRLMECGFDRSKKTLFLMEGLLYYLSPKIVDEILSFIVKNSGKGSSIIFDYLPQSVVDGSCELDVGSNFRNLAVQIGEPLLFGIKEGTIETFLSKRGFSKVQNATSEDYRKAYFNGVNKDRSLCSLLSFVHAMINNI